jgi:hypothetical protein
LKREFDLAYYGKIPPDNNRSWVEIEMLYDMLVDVKNKEEEERKKMTKS